MEATNHQNLQPFVPGDTSTVSTRWKKWKRSFEIFLDVNNVAIAARKKSYLLHYAGPQVQDIFFSLRGEDDVPPAEGVDVYQQALQLLDGYFLPMKCLPLERHRFRIIEQEEHETVENFVLRLREQGNLCEYGNHLEEEIKEQIFERGSSDELRAKILTKPEMTLAETIELGRSLETIDKHRKSLLHKAAVDVNKVSSSPSTSSKGECFRCGRTGHYANDDECPAKDRKCERCGLIGHFKKRCKTKSTDRKNQRGSGRIRQVNVNQQPEDTNDGSSDSEESDEESVQYLFQAGPDFGEKVTVAVGGVKVDWIVDSGAGVNVINGRTWKTLKDNLVRVKHQTKEVDKTLKAYGGHRIKVKGRFTADVATKDKSVEAEIYVVEEEGVCLLGRQTAKDLGILRIKTNVWTVNQDEKRIGKIIGVEANIQIDETIKPVQQTQCNIPIPLREKTEREIQRLLEQDVIEPAPRDSRWISRLVIRPKPGDPMEVRLCVDMRDANRAIIPQHYPLPTFDSIVPHLNNCKWFSKIDLNKAFHQVALSESSREITTFATPGGYFRYKRLMFGLNCASEIFQNVMERLLTGIPGVKSFIDDVVVFAETKEAHDKILQAVMARLTSHGVTINTRKCEFGKREVVFMGHRLSGAGISPSEDKVEAVKSFREPRSTEELRSFLGLVNYLGKFIPDLATLTTPLRELLRKDARFQWNKEQKQAFCKIKAILANPSNLGYYSPLDKTILIADASPTGLGAVLIQEKDGQKRVICYISKGLSETEKAYAQNEKEALALVWSAERLEMYLRGKEFLLLTDHQPLKVIFGRKQKACPRIERWALRLQSFRFKIVHIPGKVNIADCLSRLSQVQDCKTYDQEGESMLMAIVQSMKPNAVSLDEIANLTQKDDELTWLKEALLSGTWKDQLRKYLPFKDELMVVNGIVLRGDRIIVPASLRKRILALSHISHPGIERTKQRLRSKVWWPNMDKEAEAVVKSCIDCQIVGQPSRPEPMAIRELPESPWSHVSMDILGPLPSGESLLVIIDLYSRYRITEVLRRGSTGTTDIVEKIRPIFLRMGMPDVLLTDNASNFSSGEMEEFCKHYAIQLKHTTPYWPQANGEVERQNRSILKILRIAALNHTDWKKDLDELNYVYSLTPHPATGRSPAELAFGREFRDWIPYFSTSRHQDDEEVRDRDLSHKLTAKARYDRTKQAHESIIREGDQVLMRNMVKQNKLSTPFIPVPCTVIKKEGSSVLVETPEGVEYRRSSAHLKKLPQSRMETFSEEEDPNAWSTPAEHQPEATLEERRSERRTGEAARPRRQVRRPLRFDDYDMGVDDDGQ